MKFLANGNGLMGQSGHIQVGIQILSNLLEMVLLLLLTIVDLCFGMIDKISFPIIIGLLCVKSHVKKDGVTIRTQKIATNISQL